MVSTRGIGPPISMGSSLGNVGANPTASKQARDIWTRWRKIKNKRSNWEWQWQDALKYLVPHKDFVTRKRAIQGETTARDVYDTTARQALQIMAAGFHGNLTNPSTRWFNLGLEDPRAKEPRDVRIWLDQVQDIMFDVISASNFDEQIFECYIDLGSAGTSVLFEFEDDKDIIRFRCVHVSEISIGEDDKERVTEVYRQFSLTPMQAFQKWGDKAGPKIKKMLAEKKFDDPVQYLQAIFPREFRDVSSSTSDNLPIANITMELEEQRIIENKGFEEMPAFATRFFKVAGDPYGYSPGILMLPDIKMLQQITKTIIRSAQKLTDPPLVLPHDGFLLPLKTDPAGINYKLSGNPNERIEPLLTGANIPVGREEQLDVRTSINKAYFTDLFLALADRRNMTATEVVERVQEKGLMLGPVLGRLQTEMLDPIISRTFNILSRKGILPPPPAALGGQSITVEYISPLANAQRGAKITSVTNILGLTGQMAQFVPEVIDKIDTDKAVDEAADVFGVPPSLIRDEEQVLAIRQQRAEQQAAIAQAQAIAQGAEVAKTVSEAEKNASEAAQGAESA